MPTANDDHVYFVSNIKINGKWQESVLSWSLKSAETQDKADIIGSGNFPAATQKGVIYAGSAGQKTSKFKAYSKLMRNDGHTSSTVFSMSSENAKWGISGVWAHKDYRAVSFPMAPSTAATTLAFGQMTSRIVLPGYMSNHQTSSRR
ncbi:hypothetical protein [Bifidobacterium angulatum]